MLGIISIVSLVLTPFCCITIPGVFCAPFAWGIGAKAKREIGAAAGRLRQSHRRADGDVDGDRDDDHRSSLVIAGFIALVVWIGYTDYSLV